MRIVELQIPLHWTLHFNLNDIFTFDNITMWTHFDKGLPFQYDLFICLQIFDYMNLVQPITFFSIEFPIIKDGYSSL